MTRKYCVRGLLKRGHIAKQFSTVVEASSIKNANQSIKDKVRAYCESNHAGETPVQCIINKKTVRCD